MEVGQAPQDRQQRHHDHDCPRSEGEGASPRLKLPGGRRGQIGPRGPGPSRYEQRGGADGQRRVPRQGGGVGYAIILFGSLAGILGLTRLVVVSMTSRRVAAQKTSRTISKDNPLGRVLTVWDQNQEVDVDTLELKLDEVIMREASQLDRLLWVVKVASVLAPLMGLLGTVPGMIRTFQSIMLYGAGDPKLMAGGISEALVTTMLGLLVAIPLVFLHAWVYSGSKRVVEVLEEQAAGIIARRAEAS